MNVKILVLLLCGMMALPAFPEKKGKTKREPLFGTIGILVRLFTRDQPHACILLSGVIFDNLP